MTTMDDYQHGKTPDVWSQALWLGAALEALKVLSKLGIESPETFNSSTARAWIERVPNEVKAKWPGVFPEFPYAGETEEERAERVNRMGE